MSRRTLADRAIEADEDDRIHIETDAHDIDGVVTSTDKDRTTYAGKDVTNYTLKISTTDNRATLFVSYREIPAGVTAASRRVREFTLSADGSERDVTDLMVYKPVSDD